MPQYMHPKTLAFLNAARYEKDSGRPMLENIAVHHSFLLSLDGFRMHAVRFSPEPEVEKRADGDLCPETTCNIDLVADRKSKDKQLLKIVASGVEIGNKYLLNRDIIRQVIPAERQRGRITINRQFLLDVLDNLPDEIEDVCIEVQEDTSAPVCLYARGSGTDYFAVIMPIHNGGYIERWRPL